MRFLKRLFIFVAFGLVLAAGIYYFPFETAAAEEKMPVAKTEYKSFDVDVKSVGELEAARSTIIASSVKGDIGKIIYLIADGTNVQPGELLVKMDPTPFEEKVEKLKSQLKEQATLVHTLEKTLEWEINQAEHEIKTAAFETETAELELSKIVNGDGPLEISRLRAAMQKAWLKYDELNAYSNDLLELEEQGFLNPIELKQAQKKLAEEKEAYEVAKMQYDSYINHVFPMQQKKAEAALKRCRIKQEEIAKTGGYKIGKASALLEQAKQELESCRYQLKDAEHELALAEIKAPAPGMVVHREEFRSGQKRKPRIGDILVKNQPLLDLPDLDSMVVKTRVREVDLYKIAIGKPVTVEVDAYPQLSFTGKVSSIGVLALSDLIRPSEEKYFDVRVALDKGDQRLRPGMTARLTIHADQVSHELAIPLHAIFEEQKQCFCYVCGPEGYEKRFIETGISNDHWMEIKSGLQEGEWICLINPHLKE